MDIISDEEHALSCIQAVMNYLLNEFKSWDVIHLSHVSDDSSLLKFIQTNYTKMDAEIQYKSIAPYIPIRDSFDGSYDKYVMSLSRNKRHDLRRRNKKLIVEENVRYEEDNPKRNADCIKTLFTLHKMRADSKRIATTFSGDTLQRYHEEIARMFQDNGWLTLRVMKKGDKVLASLYCFEFAGKVFAYQSGIDPAWESKGVGSAILFNLVEEAFHNKRIEFDFLRGGEEYKGTWTEYSRSQYNINIYSDSLTSRIIKKTNEMRSMAKELIINR